MKYGAQLSGRWGIISSGTDIIWGNKAFQLNAGAGQLY